jgi:hypothetical protein
MQIMYLRVPGKKNNKGMHPIGVIAVDSRPFDQFRVAVQLIHSKDRFCKAHGRDLIKRKLDVDYLDFPAGAIQLQLHSLLPKSILGRLDYHKHQAILDRLIEDEITVVEKKASKSYSTNIDY